MISVQQRRAIIIGDSTNNTLSIIRSLGEAKLEQCLILKCDKDICFVAKSKYLKKNQIFHIKDMEECMFILEKLKTDFAGEQTLICSFDEAAVFIDENEALLSPFFRTPSKGKRIGNMFNKDAQCRLAVGCGLTVPESLIFHRGDNVDNIEIAYPILLKPQNSTRGEKSDIHICKNKEDVIMALQEESRCETFVLQEFIDKDYELDCIGVRTENGVYLPGGVRKIRHYPYLVGAGAFGLFMPNEELGIDLNGVELFLRKVGYYGPFSVEFLHKGDKNYFMEVNFRNEGLAYAATVAGANLHALYLNPQEHIDHHKVRRIYLMNYSLDFLYVKNGDVSLGMWLRDFFRTSCFINFNWKDPMPTICYYFNKLKRCLIK